MFVQWTVAAALLQLASTVGAHGHDEGMADMDNGVDNTAQDQQEGDPYYLPSYAGLSAHSGLMMAHIGLMVLAWFFILPIGIMFSIARSRYTLPVQFLFLIVNGVGVVLATIYNANTPDLYENNAHHTIGWIATWVMTAQTVMSLLFLYSGRVKMTASSSDERVAYLPVSAENMDQYHVSSPYRDTRWSGDSGSPTGRSSTTLNSSRDISPTDAHRLSKEAENEDVDDEEGLPMLIPTSMSTRTEHSSSPSRFRIRAVHAFLSRKVPTFFSKKLLFTAQVGYEIVDRTILILGWIAIVTGGVTLAGWMRADNVFGGLAHFIKGGIFFWYGLLTLGRFMGCFSDFSWAWNNAKPLNVDDWRARIPSAEFTESFVIWLYGASNVFLEHLAGWGQEWVAQDLEHVSIAIMFFGGGLLGMLVESKTIRRWLNTPVDVIPMRKEMQADEADAVRQEPRQYAHSMNPVPALVILLLGIMMSSHHQDSAVSTTVHGQWGTLLAGFSVARIVTYLFLYLAPPTSIWPARPPSELVASFCLISGGLVFMASTRDVIRWMEDRNLMAMFIFTVVMGFTALLMAWQMLVLALKGWAVRREAKLSGASVR